MNGTDDEMDTAPDSGTTRASTPDVTVQRIEISGRTIWQAIGAILTTFLAIWAIREASGLVAMVAISFFFSLALEPAVRSLTKRYGWRRGSATGVIYVAGILFVGFMVLVLIPTLTDLATAIRLHGKEWLDNLNDFTSSNLGFTAIGTGSALNTAGTAGNVVGNFGKDAFGNVLDLATAGIGFLFNLATVAMFTFYFTADAPRVQRAVLRLFSPKAQERIGWTWDQAIVQTGGYFYSRLILMVINGIGFFFTMVVVGMPVGESVALALIGGFISEFIPAIGTYIGGAIPIAITLAVQGLVPALILLGYVLVYQQVENYVLSPKISANTMTLNGGVAFGAALAGGAIAGPMGAFTALPIAALISSFVSNYVVSHEVVYESTTIGPTTEGRKHRRHEREDEQQASAGGAD